MPSLRFGDAFAPLRRSLCRCLCFSALPNHFFAFRLCRTASSLRQSRCRCLCFSALLNRFSASLLFGFAEPLLRFSALPNRFGGADAEKRRLRRSGRKEEQRKEERRKEEQRKNKANASVLCFFTYATRKRKEWQSKRKQNSCLLCFSASLLMNISKRICSKCKEEGNE
uniref:Uncharacterized protein n=1 Tax=Hydrodictyon reticulatum TaxID=3107 RepID=A0A1W5RMY3_HYDRE|nr:hypothetical protein [Hydrodictyon reticulatum]AQU64556.1 hypothetical protein [Hydrodictyon reticulatum]